ncbi:MAG: hypothetical protein Q8S17_03995 [Humidesulfovibrio sp.]|nr:hypothetical protein [Humidesulfovibrio sp.]
MISCPCVPHRTISAPARALKPSPRRSLPWLLALAALLVAAPAAQAQTPQVETPQVDDRGLAPGPARYILVKAVGQGVGAEEAEQDALDTARLMAAKHYKALGGSQALDLSPKGMRIIANHSTPPMGLATVRAVALLELRLKPLPEPPPPALDLPVLRVGTDTTPQITVEANRACEVMIAVDSALDEEDGILPGGGGAAYRLAPDKPMQLALPKITPPASLRVLACTGGLYAPAIATTLDEAFAKARAGKPRLATLQGVVSECVEIKTALPGQDPMAKRSMRQKSSQSPVNMTGAAGREAGLPVPGDPIRNLP